MSSDGKYILAYECQPYLKPTPMEDDKNYIEKEFGGEVIIISEFLLYWEKPKYQLDYDVIKKLYADQVFECLDCGYWVIVK